MEIGGRAQVWRKGRSHIELLRQIQESDPFHRFCFFGANPQHAHFLELGVIRTFDFVSSLRRMSVIVKRLKANSMEVYVKGAPEIMPDICDPESCESRTHVQAHCHAFQCTDSEPVRGNSPQGLR